MEGHTSWVCSIVDLGDRLLTSSSDHTVRVWGMDQGTGMWQCERVLRDHVSNVSAMAITRDGRRVLSCDNGGGMLVWEEARTPWPLPIANTSSHSC